MVCGDRLPIDIDDHITHGCIAVQARSGSNPVRPDAVTYFDVLSMQKLIFQHFRFANRFSSIFQGFIFIFITYLVFFKYDPIPTSFLFIFVLISFQ